MIGERQFSMRIWHAGAHRRRHTVNGVSSAVWSLAAAQASRGHDVTLFVDRPEASHLAAADRLGLKMRDYREVARVARPDVAHTHSVFTPVQAAFSARLRLRRIPYIVTPHGGLMPPVLSRHSLLKRVYSGTVERLRMHASAGAQAVSAGEVGDIRAFAGPGLPVRAIANIVSPPPTVVDTPRQREGFLYLGRGDVQWKGLDRLCGLARALPDEPFWIVGPKRPLAIELPPNVVVREPVGEEEKWSLIRRSKALIHLARWEVFGVSMMEAMLCGTPVIASGDVYLSDWLRQNGQFVVDSLSDALDAARLVADGAAGYDASASKAAVSSLTAEEHVVPEITKFYREVTARHDGES